MPTIKLDNSQDFSIFTFYLCNHIHIHIFSAPLESKLQASSYIISKYTDIHLQKIISSFYLTTIPFPSKNIIKWFYNIVYMQLPRSFWRTRTSPMYFQYLTWCTALIWVIGVGGIAQWQSASSMHKALRSIPSTKKFYQLFSLIYRHNYSVSLESLQLKQKALILHL